LGCTSLRVAGGNPFRTEAFRDGMFHVMGPSSFRVAEIAARHAASAPPGPGALDCCAAPGGKLIRLRLAGAAAVCGVDSDARRIRLVQDNLRIMQLGGVWLVVADMSREPPFSRKFGLVLLDAPCSGLGVTAKIPEIKWRAGAGDLRRLSEKQAMLLERAYSLLPNAGTLVYSVCSLEPEEGELMIRRFLERHGDAVLVKDGGMGVAEPDDDGFFRFFPRPGMQDGFFAAVIGRGVGRSKRNAR
jgi:16S rRNA (cytosine967-C5)-methyltransferase